MKTFCFMFFALLLCLYSCKSVTKTEGPKARFGIHEIVAPGEIPLALLDSLKSKPVQMEKNPNAAVIGYISKGDTGMFGIDFSKQPVSIATTFYPVDKEQTVYAAVAIRSGSSLDNADIQKTRANGNAVEIYFNLAGARKWADLTRHNTGKPVVFLINGRIYAMPTIQAEIRNGMAMISGLENESTAQSLSKSLK